MRRDLARFRSWRSVQPPADSRTREERVRGRKVDREGSHEVRQQTAAISARSFPVGSTPGLSRHRSQKNAIEAGTANRIQLGGGSPRRMLEKNVRSEIASNLWVIFLVFALMLTLGITFSGIVYTFSESSEMLISIPLTALTLFLSAVLSTALGRA